eukprot:TRINITY_DN2367_c0_g1_i2.p1 TRINITY_DN2367_c0_g1~~TRINITY_DN2367_c0_g1_i2.p1  ORF type:complete len:778 (+),score=302.94 TRINITY_DN2367_c0_g1_i2:1160-3493(+)
MNFNASSSNLLGETAKSPPPEKSAETPSPEPKEIDTTSSPELTSTSEKKDKKEKKEKKEKKDKKDKEKKRTLRRERSNSHGTKNEVDPTSPESRSKSLSKRRSSTSARLPVPAALIATSAPPSEPLPQIPADVSPPQPPKEEKVQQPETEEEIEKKRQREENLRLKVINEITKTEKDYVGDLDKTVSIFIEPLRSHRIIEQSSIISIFSNLELIVNINKEFLKKLEDRLEDSSPRYWLVGDIFLTMSDYMKMYTAYCSSHDTAMATFEKLIKENHGFQEWYQETVTKPALNGLSLRDYLVKPIQRICRYPLLLKELLKHTHDLHADHDKLLAALAKMEKIASYVNEAKRHDENIAKVLEIQTTVAGCENIVGPTRVFIREGPLQKVSQGKSHLYHWFLFNDLLIYCKSSKRTFGSTKKPLLQWKGKISLQSALIQSLPDTKETKNAFQLAILDKPITQFTLCANTPEDKDVWMEALNKVIADEENKKKNWRSSQETSGLDSPRSARSRSSPLSTSRETDPVLPLSAVSNTDSPRSSPRSSLEFRQRTASSEAAASPALPRTARSDSGSAISDTPDESKLRAWKKSSMATASMDVLKNLEEEKRKRADLEQWKALHEIEMTAAKNDLKVATETLQKEKQNSQAIKKELDEVKEKLVNTTMELMKLKDDQQNGVAPAPIEKKRSESLSDSKDASPSSPTPAEPQVRSWNKKVIYDMQDVSRQLNNEKKARKELEQWKVEQEEKMEEMKKKVRKEVEDRVKLEEALKKVERELQLLKQSK